MPSAFLSALRESASRDELVLQLNRLTLEAAQRRNPKALVHVEVAPEMTNSEILAEIELLYNQRTEELITPQSEPEAFGAPGPGATITADDGTLRQSYYGDGKQPWDTIKANGWAHHFAAGNVVKYLRRTKEPGSSKAKARWYHRELYRLLNHGAYNPLEVGQVIKQLERTLTPSEVRLLVDAQG